MTQLQVGDKVHYIPFNGCDESKYENGVVKEIPDDIPNAVRVVYHCAEEWDNYMNYTSALTPVDKLRLGWIELINQEL